MQPTFNLKREQTTKLFAVKSDNINCEFHFHSHIELLAVIDGAVEVTVTGKKVVTKVKLDPDAVDPDDVEMLEDLIMVAVNEAIKKAEDASSAAMSRMTGGMGGFPF